MKKDSKILTYNDMALVYTYLFRTVSILPLDQSTTLSWILSPLLTIYFHVVNTMYYTMFLSDSIRKLVHDELEVEHVFETVFIQGLCSRFFILYFKRYELKRLMHVCAELWHLLVGTESRLVKLFERKVRFLMHYFLWTALVTVVSYIITARVVRLPPTEVNGTERRILPNRFYVDVQEQPWYDIVSVMGSIICFSYCIILTAIEIVGPFLVMMACGYLRSVQKRLLSMAETTASDDITMNDKSTKSEGNHSNKLSMSDIVKCVKFHQKIMDFCQEIEHFTRSIFIVQVMCTAYNISLIGLRIIQHDPKAARFVPILILNILQLFTCQWIPEHLLHESKSIVNAAYSASLVHPEYEPEANRALLIMMLRAKRPMQMTAGGYINLSLETFKQMTTSAISFFAVLRSMQD